MRMRITKQVLAVFVALMMAASSAMAVQYVTFDDIPGDWNDYKSAVRWMNADYVPTSDHTWVDTDLLDGGQVAPGVFEFIADPAHAYQNPTDICAYLYIDVPGEILYVSAFEGNWSTQEYMLMNCVATDGMYVDIFFPSFDRNGKLLNTDRVYLCEYEVDGEWYYECVTFYFRYDGEETRSFLPKAEKSVSFKEAEPTPEPTPEPVMQSEPTLAPAESESNDTASADADNAAIAVIGGADGPTSVFVAGSSDGFGSFFENVLSGMLEGAQEDIDAVQIPPVTQTAPETPAPGSEAAEAPAQISQNENALNGADAEPKGGMLDFFSGVIGAIGK